MTLYKYVTAERIDVLQNGLIRFTQASALNDPWDMRPHVERLITENDLEEHITGSLKPQTDKQLIDYFSQIIDDFAKTNGLGDKSLDQIRQMVTEANDTFPGELKQLFDGAFTETLEKMREVLPQIVGVIPEAMDKAVGVIPEAMDKAVGVIPEAMDKAVGVLSLTEKPDHPLMWSHYANNHSGLALAFDETNEFFRSPRHGQPDDAGSARRVNGNKTEYEIKGTVAIDEANDIVLLEVETGIEPDLERYLDPLAKALPLAKDNLAQIGDEVYVVGNPEGLVGTFSQGIISAFRGTDYIQITAPISPGSSGGPAINRYREVIGIATAFIKEGQNLNFAIPVAKLFPLLANRSGPKPITPRINLAFDGLYGATFQSNTGKMT